MAKAVRKNTTLAESDIFETVEGNIYFPADAVRREYFMNSDKKSTCPWKGVARYYSISVDGGAENLRGHIAFWRGIEVTP